MLRIDGPRAGRHPGKMPDGIKLADCTYELMAIFEQMTISDKDRASREFMGMSAMGAGMEFYDAADREPYVARWYLQDAAKNAMMRALSTGQLPIWTDYDGKFVELDPEAMFAPNKWVAAQTVQTGTYVALNVAHGRDGPTRSECDGATLWVRNDDWPRVRGVLLAEREKAFGGVLPSDMSQLLNEAQLSAMNVPSVIGYTAATGIPMWSLYEAVAWLGAQDSALVDHQHPRHLPGTIDKSYGAVAWIRLEQSLSDRIASGTASMTADVARDRLIAACESGLVQATGIPADRSDRQTVPPVDFVGAKLWEGRGGSLHRSVDGSVEAPRWFDLRFREADVRTLVSGLVTQTTGASSSTKSRRFRASAPVGSPWSEDEMTTAIKLWTQANACHDRDRAWRDDFRSRQTEHGWGNQNFRDHWTKALKSEGKPGPKPRSAPNSA